MKELLLEEPKKNEGKYKIIDFLGRKTKNINQPLIYLYDDGKVEKRIVIE